MTAAIGAVHRRHRQLAGALSVAAVAGVGLTPAMPDPVRVALLAVLVATLGLPHGAVDHIQGRAVFAPKLGRAWWLVFGALYVAAAALVIVGWLAWPPGLLVGFLILAARHFGSEDVAAVAVTRHRLARPGEIWLRGALPIVGPILAHPERTAGLFADLLPGLTSAHVLAPVTALQPLAGAAWLAVGALAAVALARRDWLLGAELGVLMAVVTVLPPLLAFVVYFCLWHAPRHTIAVVDRLAPGRPWVGVGRFARSAWPLTVASVVAGVVALAWLAGERDVTAATVAVVFVGLAALTVPHVILAAADAGREAGRTASTGAADPRDRDRA